MDVQHNIIHLFRRQGLTHQQAVDQVNDMIQNCFHRWDVAQAEIPSWGPLVDIEVQKYVTGCQELALGNLHWR